MVKTLVRKGDEHRKIVRAEMMDDIWLEILKGIRLEDDV